MGLRDRIKAWTAKYSGLLEDINAGVAANLGGIPIFGNMVRGVEAHEAGKRASEEAPRVGREAEAHTKEATKQAQTKYANAENILRQYIGKVEGVNEPWLQAGLQALAQMQSQPGFSYKDFNFEFNPEEDPSFKFRMQQALKAIQQSAAARGGLFSGAVGKALEQRASNLASEEYNRAYQRALSTYRTNLGKAWQEYQSGRQKLANLINAGLSARNALSQAYLTGGRGLAGIGQGAGNIGLRGTIAAEGFGTQGAYKGIGYEYGSAMQQSEIQRQSQEDTTSLLGLLTPFMGGGDEGSPALTSAYNNTMNMDIDKALGSTQLTYQSPYNYQLGGSNFSQFNLNEGG